MKIYIAGAWVEQHQRARPMIARVREASWTITCDWTQVEGDVCSCGHHRHLHESYARKYIEAGDRCIGGGCDCFKFVGIGVDSKLTKIQRAQYAEADFKGVLDADVVWLLAANTQQSAGAWCELGMALAAARLRKWVLREEPVTPIIIVSGPKWQRTIFTELADARFPTDEEGLAHVLSLYKE